MVMDDSDKIQISRIKGYKITEVDLTCIGKQYSCPGEFEEDLEPMPCKQGMHFSENLTDALLYKPIIGLNGLLYSDPVLWFASNDLKLVGRVFEVESYGFFMRGRDKICTNKLKFIRELTISEIVRRLNFENQQHCKQMDFDFAYRTWDHLPVIVRTTAILLLGNMSNFEKQRLEYAAKDVDKKGE